MKLLDVKQLQVGHWNTIKTNVCVSMYSDAKTPKSSVHYNEEGFYGYSKLAWQYIFHVLSQWS